MPKIRKRNLRKRIGQTVRVEGEGIRGNVLKEDGTIEEGSLLGILEEDRDGFQIKMFKSSRGKNDTFYDHESFIKERYRLKSGDSIYLRNEKSSEKYLVI